MLPLIAGVGSPHGDDRAGWLVIEALHRRGYPTGRAVCLRHPTDLWTVAAEETSLWLCDAGVGLAAPGTIVHVRWPEQPLPRDRPHSSHDLPLGDVLELLRRFSARPVQAEIWIIVGQQWSAGSEPGAEVCRAAIRLAETLWQRAQNSPEGLQLPALAPDPRGACA